MVEKWFAPLKTRIQELVTKVYEHFKEIDDLYKTGYSSQPVQQRIQNAEKEPTCLMAIIWTIKIYWVTLSLVDPYIPISDKCRNSIKNSIHLLHELESISACLNTS